MVILRARNENLDRYRDLFNANEGETLINNSLNLSKKQSLMDTSEIIQSNSRAAKKRSEFSDILMHSEWLVDIPCDISTEWIMVPVPQGKRSLVVAQQVFLNNIIKNYRNFNFCRESQLSIAK